MDDYQWIIPKELLGFNLEDWYNSNERHYDVRYAHYDKLQNAEGESGRRYGVHLSRRLRKVSKLLKEKEKAMELQVIPGEAGSLFKLLCNLDI